MLQHLMKPTGVVRTCPINDGAQRKVTLCGVNLSPTGASEKLLVCLGLEG